MQRSCCNLTHHGSNIHLDALLQRFAFVLDITALSSRFRVGPYFRELPGNRPACFCLDSERNNMAWYAYCLTEHQALPNGTRARRPFLLEGIQGVNGAPVLSYPSGEFAVVVSEFDRTADRGKLEENTVLDHARVVSVCFRTGTVLPFRFGTIFDSDDALRQAVRTNRRAFGMSVERLRGKAEMHLKVLVKDGSLR